MVHYSDSILKTIKKDAVPRNIIDRFMNAFASIDLTRDLSLFDIKPIKDSEGLVYRMRKGNYRAIFRLEDNDIYVLIIGKRDEVYKLWEQQQ